MEQIYIFSKSLGVTIFELKLKKLLKGIFCLRFTYVFTGELPKTYLHC